MATRLLTQIRKLEAKRRADAAAAIAADEMLLATFMPASPLAKPLDPQDGEEVATDYYLSSDPLWAPNYCMLEGTAVERLTRDPSDFGIVYDMRGAGHHKHDWEQGPPRDLPELARLGPTGLDPEAIRTWSGTSRIPKVPRGRAKRSGSASAGHR